MKKQLALTVLTVLSASTAMTYAAQPILNLEKVFSGEFGFGYTANQNITVEGFKTTTAADENNQKDFVVTSPFLKNSEDVEVEEYSILLAKESLTHFGGEGKQPIESDFSEFKFQPNSEDKSLGNITLKLSIQDLDTDTNYFGVVVPTDDNVQEGHPSKEFCFNTTSEKYAEGGECKTFANPVVASDDTAEVAEEEHGAAGADMRLANISHSVSTDNKITLTWKALSQSANVEIQVFDKAREEFVTLATVPMSQERYEYQVPESTEELIFAFIPRDEKGKEVRYTANVRTESDVTPEIKTTPKVGPVEDMMLILAVAMLAYV